MRNIKFGKPMIGNEERNAVQKVLENDILVHGPVSRDFENAFADFTGSEHAVTLSSCTAGLHLSYHCMGIGDGDEIIVPAETHVATVHAVEYVKAKPIFIDAEISTGNIDIDRVEENITDKTRAISIVHYLGMPVDMIRIMEIAEKYKLKVIEDCALGIGSTIDNKHVGLFGDTGCFSFYPVKHITTAEGGMLITKDKSLYEKINSMKAFGYDKTVSERKIPGEYDVNQLGYNYRMNEMQAAIGLEQMKKIDSFLKIRKENYIHLEKGLNEIDEVSLFQSSNDRLESSYYCLSLILSNSLASKRLDIIKSLKSKGIGTSIYYPKPIPHFAYYKEKYNFSDDSFPVAGKISYNSIALPVGPHLDIEDMKYIIENLKDTIMEVK